jgi:tRNA/tmRNA/rRNA uracil-C5-methylase (TrmA/RlmC/RlmD family)
MESRPQEPLITKPVQSISLLQTLCCCVSPEEEPREEAKVHGLNFSMLSTKSESLEVSHVNEFAAKRTYLIGKGRQRIFAQFQHLEVRKNFSTRQNENKPQDIEESLWADRFLIFSKFDDGVKLDETAWSTTTHETIGKKIAQTCSANVVIDAFCGVGGNTIQFARKYKVIAIDIDQQKVE